MGQNIGRQNIHFAKVYGVPEAFSLGGRADYVWVEEGPSDKENISSYKFHVWQNQGSGATKLKGKLSLPLFGCYADLIYLQPMATAIATCWAIPTEQWIMSGFTQLVT